jgi:large subunit ribosomal protein L6
MSRIGKLPVVLPDKVKVSASSGGKIVVEGPKGILEYQLPEGISLKQEDKSVTLTRESDHRRHKALHGTARSLISSMVRGVTEGFIKEMEIQGVGYRAAVKGDSLDLQLGFSHPISHPIPKGLKVSVDNNTLVKVEGIDRQLVGQFAAEVRSYRRPEPYKGKGIRYKGEQVRRKAGKSVQ